jgi:uncharacterized cupin superfamily protein
MVPEARLEDVGSGLTPVSEGWFVVNVADAAWLVNDAFGARCVFEADVPVIRGRPELSPVRFPQLGFRIAVLYPGKPTTMSHADPDQEDFLVLSGECLLLVEDEERPLRAWDFFHCAGGTAHSFVGAGDGPCVLLMVGARTPEGVTMYRRSEAALCHDASVEEDTDSPHEAYARYSHWQPGRPSGRWPWT